MDISVAVFQRSAHPTPLIEAARHSGLQVHVIRDRFPGDPRVAVALAALVRRPEVAVLQTHGYKANVLGCFVRTAPRRPWVAFLHGDTWENRKVRFYFALERLAVRRADRIIVVSHDMARKAVEWGLPSTKVRVVHNASVIIPVETDPVPAWSTDAPPVVGVIGRLSPEKGVDLALRVHVLVSTRLAGARLLVAGEGPEEAELKRCADRMRIGHSVTWVGYQEDLTDFYSRLALLLIPSRSEGLPNVALEAMARGLPVVATRVGGLSEVIRDGETGFLLPSDDAEGLAERSLQLLLDAPLRKRLGQAARARVSSSFSLQARRRSLARLYEEVLA